MGDAFPYLSESMQVDFPSPLSTEDDIVAVGGNLSPGMLLSAYRQGIFPWYSDEEPILWWSLDPRFVLFPNQLTVSKSMKKIIRHGNFRLSIDKAFSEVINQCGLKKRKGQSGTWITEDMKEAYIRLHELGYAHSVETWIGNELAGGLYGISLGKCFYGESMFSHSSNASKAAFISLVGVLKDLEFPLIDCQQHTAHLESLGAVDIPKKDFLQLLEKALNNDTLKGDWGMLFPNFPESVLWRSILL